MENKQTAMQKLLLQLKEERRNIPMDIEWDRCYQAIEMVIQNTYLPIEKEQIIEAFKHGELPPLFVNYNAEQYYNETYVKRNTPISEGVDQMESYPEGRE